MPIPVDGFEDGDVSGYSTWDSGTFSTTQSTVYEGNYAGALSNPGNWLSSVTTVAYNNSTLPAYPKPGDTFGAWVAMNTGSVGLAFGWAGNSGYNISQDTGGTTYIERKNSGSNTQIASASVSASTGTWYWHEVTWGTDGTITIDILDTSGNSISGNLPLTVTDTTHTNLGVGVFSASDVGSTATAYIDGIEITGGRVPAAPTGLQATIQ